MENKAISWISWAAMHMDEDTEMSPSFVCCAGQLSSVDPELFDEGTLKFVSIIMSNGCHLNSSIPAKGVNFSG